MIRWLLFVTSCLGFAGEGDIESFAERRAAMDPVSRRFLRPNDDIRSLPTIDGIEPTPIEFHNGSGATLRGTLYDHPATNRAVVICLGIRGNHTYLLPYARIVLGTPCDVLLFDYQGFGRSDGVANALSLLGDTLSAIDFLLADSREPKDIAVFGLSLGSVLGLGAAAERQVRAYLGEDLWIPSEMMERVLGGGDGNALFRMARAVVERTLVPALDPGKNLARFRGRALLMHGDADPLLPAQATLRITASRSAGTRVWMIPHAGHAPETLETHEAEYRRQILEFLRESFELTPTRTLRVSSFAMVGENAHVTLENRGAEFAQLTFTDGKSLQHAVVQVASDRRTECSIALPFLATQVIATPQFTARFRNDGRIELAASPLSRDLATFREFERLAQPPISTTSMSSLARRYEAIERALPDATQVSREVAPRYALALNAFARSAIDIDFEIAQRAVQALLPFVPENPEEWVEIGSGHFAIGLRDAALAQTLAKLARNERTLGNTKEADRLDSLARRLAPR